MRLKKIIFVVGFVALCGTPFNASAATLSLSPSSGSVSVGQTISVNVLVSSADQAMNAASGGVSFPSDKLEVISISKSNSIVTLWAQEPSFSNANGTVSFEGVVLNPGFTGASGKIVSITFRAKSEGSARLSFPSGSVLANDGQGTEILTGSGGAIINVQESSAPAVAPSATKPAPTSSASAVVITSSTHSDKTKWYSNNSPEFSWDLPAGATEVRTSIGENPKGTPSVRYSPAISSKVVENLPDGTYYFSLQVRTSAGWGTVSRLQVNIDKTPPNKFSITFPNGVSGIDPQPAVLFNTSDRLSGVDHYEVSVGDNAASRTTASLDSNPYKLPTQAPGAYKLAVRVFDRAGNVTEALANFNIEGAEPPKILDYPTELTLGEDLKIHGTTYPNATLGIAINQGDKQIVTESTKSNSVGDFNFVISKNLWPGSYTFVAWVTDSRGTRSPDTAPLGVTIHLNLFSDAVSLILNYFLIALSTLVGVVIISATAIWSWYKLRLLSKRLKDETGVVEEVIHHSFGVMRKGVTKHIRDLRKISAKRMLTSEELMFLDQFEEVLAQAEQVISKEVEKMPRSKNKKKPLSVKK